MNLNNITTEARNSNTLEIDTLSSLNLVKKINEEDQRVPIAIAKVLPDIARVVDEIIGAFQKGGRLIYIGAGTSGRLGILDASECPPTYGTNPDMVLGIIAGGQKAIRDAVEGAEDDFEQGQADLKEIHLTEKDVVVGIAASGRTPYTIGALQYALSVGAVTVSVVSSLDSEMSKISKHTIAVIVGAEVIMGSTRMKAGTSQKLVLNMLSTASMIKIGKVYSNLMVDVQATNIKLIQRAKNIVILATGASDIEASEALTEQNGQTKAAILQLLTGRKSSDAIALLEKHAGKLRDALKEHHQD